jgi:hypothetical protein
VVGDGLGIARGRRGPGADDAWIGHHPDADAWNPPRQVLGVQHPDATRPDHADVQLSAHLHPTTATRPSVVFQALAIKYKRPGRECRSGYNLMRKKREAFQRPPGPGARRVQEGAATRRATHLTLRLPRIRLAID